MQDVSEALELKKEEGGGGLLHVIFKKRQYTLPTNIPRMSLVNLNNCYTLMA